MSVHFPTKITEYFYPAQKEYVPVTKKRGRELNEDGETDDDDRVSDLKNSTVEQTCNEQKSPPGAPRKLKQPLPNVGKKLGKLFV
jgi:hypothetical protein